jgi:hypothetical protein
MIVVASIVSGCDGQEILQFVEEPLVEVALTLEPFAEGGLGSAFVAWASHLPVRRAPRGFHPRHWNHKRYPPANVSTPDGADHIFRAAPIMGLAFRALKKDRQAAGIGERVDLGRQPAARATHATGWCFFFCRWPRADAPEWTMSRSSADRHRKPLKQPPVCDPRRLPCATG